MKKETLIKKINDLESRQIELISEINEFEKSMQPLSAELYITNVKLLEYKERLKETKLPVITIGLFCFHDYLEIKGLEVEKMKNDLIHIVTEKYLENPGAGRYDLGDCVVYVKDRNIVEVSPKNI